MGQILSAYGQQQGYRPPGNGYGYRPPYRPGMPGSAGGSITGNTHGYNTPGNSTPGGLITQGPYAGYNNLQGLGVNGSNPGLGGRGGGIDYQHPIRTITGPGVFEGP